jgi:hypothetical protein
MVASHKTAPAGCYSGYRFLLLIAVFSTIGLSGCEIIGDIFQAGVWVGVLLVLGVLALIVWVISRAKG